jgi:DNA-binding NtrC family response regulator
VFVARILYLDDDKQLAELLEQRLAQTGHSMQTCSNSREALRVFNDSPEVFDLVLTDMSMPGGSGLEFAQEVLKGRPDTRVVIASGCEDPNWAGFARSAGVEAVLLKPLRLQEFADTISRLLSP